MRTRFVQMQSKEERGVNTQAKIIRRGSHIVYIGHVPHVLVRLVLIGLARAS